ncbi:hypothetical protein AGMMS49959_10720 [Planctomycetales bacterium]|nr:hypothetical protein AGMMS49959_10720 [Planctomycetales bacterium]
MTFNSFGKIIDDLEMYLASISEGVVSKKIKTFNFCGMGEGLLDKDLPLFIKKAKSIADEVQLITNGALLNNELSLALIDAGLDNIRISLQGLNADDYFRVCGVKLDFENFRKNIKFLYENKKQCTVCLKIIEGIDGVTYRQEDLLAVFGSICDVILTERAIRLQQGTAQLQDGTLYSSQTHEVQVCFLPFYRMYISANGDVLCGSDAIIVGNLLENTFSEVWQGKKLNDLWILQLSGKRAEHPPCSTCSFPNYLYTEYNDIDECRELLLAKYRAQYPSITHQ